MHVLIIGCGYVGERFAKQAVERGWQVTALTRSQKRAEALQLAGIRPVIGNVLEPKSLQALPQADLCLYAVGYDRSANENKRDVYVSGLKNVLSEIADRIPRLIYVSSTSVYGESTGDWVNEETPCEPANESGQICLDAEAVVNEVYARNLNRDATIVRLSGIYGPGRLIGRKEQLRGQKPISGNPDGWLNLIHVDDILQVLFILASGTPSSSLYLLSDERPNRRFEFYSELAKHLQTPAPVMPDEPSADFGKRCDSLRIRNELGVKLLRPTIQDGIPVSIE
ncbi:SDR family oxidoreductase [Thalassoglobus sp.]|uniref:SDR family oxidoreductase n=1 Tax=Thalassoglobus sp. TaxID=2795869 RepID=UPI003AA98194